MGPLRDSGAHLVKAGGAGLERGEAGRFNEFNVWTREAGAGQLAISLEGPSKAEIDFKDRKDGSCDVSYKVDEPGMWWFWIQRHVNYNGGYEQLTRARCRHCYFSSVTEYLP